MDSAQTPSRSTETTFSPEGEREPLESLLQALRQTVQGKSGSVDKKTDEKLTIRSLAGIYQYHSGRDVTAIEVVTDIVKAVAVASFPSKLMAPAIDRWAPEAAVVLLADSAARDRLTSLWSQVGAEVANGG